MCIRLIFFNMFKKILVPTDFSSSAAYAFEYALKFNENFQARLFLVHVLQDFTDFSEFNLSPSILPQLYAEFEENATNKLEEMARRASVDFVCDTALFHGIPFHEINNYADQEDMDLIILGSHGRTGIQHLIFGGTAEKIVKRAHCPVLIIKHPEASEKRRRKTTESD